MKTQGRNGNNAHKARHATAGKAGKACRVLLAVIMAISLCPGFRALADQPDGRATGGDTFAQEVGDIGTGAQDASDGAGAAVGAVASLNQGTSTAIQPADVSGGLIDFGQPDDSLADGTEGVEGPQTTDELVPADADAGGLTNA